jgi:hypothetical protein
MHPKASMVSACAKPSQRPEIGFGAAFWLRSRALHEAADAHENLGRHAVRARVQLVAI